MSRKTIPKTDTNTIKLGPPNKYDALQLAKELDEYTKNCDDPMIEEFCLAEGRPCRDTVYRLEKDCKILSDTIKRLHAKQQVRTIKKVESGTMNPTWAIFKMKQRCYGWTDKQEIEIGVVEDLKPLADLLSGSDELDD